MVVRAKRATPCTYNFVDDNFNKVDGVLDSPLNSQNCMAPDFARSTRSCPTGSLAIRLYELLKGYAFKISECLLSLAPLKSRVELWPKLNQLNLLVYGRSAILPQHFGGGGFDVLLTLTRAPRP